MSILEKYNNEIFGHEVPKGWVTVEMNEVCQLVTDGTHKTPNYINTGVRFISIKNIRPFQPINWNTYEKYISQEEHEFLIKRCKPEFDDILFPRIGTIGFAKRIDFKEEVSIFVGLGLIKQIREVILSKYLEYWMNHPFIFKLSHEKSTGSGRLTLPLAESRRLPVPLAPFNEQKRIVAKIEELFSELDKGVENLTTAREQLKVYRQALLKHVFEGKLTEAWRKIHADQLETADQLLDRIKQERDEHYQEQIEEWEKAGTDGKKTRKPSATKALPLISKDELSHLPDIPTGWGYSRLAEIALIGSGMSVSKNRKLTDPIDVPYLRVANVQRGQLILDEMKTMLVEKDKIEELKLKEFDVLFNEGGDRDKLGRGWIWESQIDPCITQNHVFRATPYLKGEFHSKFISYWGNTFGQSYFDAGGKQTTNLASINKTVLSMFPIPIPSMEEQEQIITELERATTIIDSFENDIEKALSESEALRQSILKKAFSGKLVSQNPNDEPASKLLARIQTEREQTQKEKKSSKVPRKIVKKKKVNVMADLIEVLKNTKDWLNAQEVFRQCGIADGSETDDIEKIYEELRTYEKEDKIEIERRGDEDWLRAAQEG